uniref:NADH-ubiquinone oxidoreductase chain 6 n=1 Tax=Euaesthetus ruficapillus TaxID=295609 RepID=A0A0S2M7C4_9COLE|nr:NADH deshydrogenase subunit 6 [Euaesthetus ruficapillus]
MLTMLLMTLLLSMIIIFMIHPMSMGMILLIQTILISMMMKIMNLSSWFSYILFLIMIGGMLILFIYMTSIASNEKFKFNKYILIFMSIMLLSIMINKSYFYYNKIYLNSFNNNNLLPLFLNKFMNFPSSIILFMIIIYLFITLIAVVKITNFSKGPLRQKF